MIHAIDHNAIRRRSFFHILHSLLLLAGMVCLLSLLAWIFAGPSGMWWVFIIGLVSFALSPKLSPQIIMRWHGGRPLSPSKAPHLYKLIQELARRAGLSHLPSLYIVPNQDLNAFTTGSREEAAIAMTAGLVQSLNRRELAAVLAHEVSHLKNNDLWILNLSGMVGRVTGFLSMGGQVLLIINLPLMLVSNHHFPWAGILLLVLAPSVSMLLQLAVSRSREFGADLAAAELTGDPESLALALAKIDGYRTRWSSHTLFRNYRRLMPSMMQSHPQTKERIERLLSLSVSEQPLSFTDEIRGLRDEPHSLLGWRLNRSWR